MNRHILRMLVAIGAALVTVQAYAWEIVTERVEIDWYKQRARDLVSKLKNDGFRPTSIDIAYNQETYDFYGYTAVCAPVVKNVGAHKKTWHFLYDKSLDDIVDYTEDNGYTVVDIEEYLKNGNIQYAALLEKFIPEKKKYFLPRTNEETLRGYVLGSGGKIVDLDVEEWGTPSLHGAINFNVPLTNVGWDISMTWNSIVNLHYDGKRFLDVQRRSDGSVCAVYCDPKPGQWGLTMPFLNGTWDYIVGKQEQGWRVHSVNRQDINDDWRYSGVLVWNG